MLPEKFSEIIILIKQARLYAFQTVDTELKNLYLTVGKYINLRLANVSWGEKTIDELALHIQIHHPELKGFNRRGLYRMKQVYETYASSKMVSPLMAQLETFEPRKLQLCRR